MSASKGARSFDPDILRKRYREERDKRLAADRSKDIASLTGSLARFLDDPFSEPTERAAVSDEVDAIVVGAGWGGLLSSARLREADLKRIRIIDRAGDVGGVWYWNRYPGAMCDVESYIYLPLLEELSYIPRDRYAYAPEIFSHAQAIARHYDLYELALFHTSVTDVTWDPGTARWTVRTDRGDELSSRFVVLANGALSRLKVPEIPGIDRFTGHMFHTSRWDYDYTGGDSFGNLTRLEDKIVGVVGTGATAIQVVPMVAKYAKELYVFERTPATVAKRDQRSTDWTWAASLQPGWQAERIRNFTAILSGEPQPVDLVNDSWTDLYGNLLSSAAFIDKTGAERAQAMEIVDMERMEAIRARIDSIVEDRKTAEALKPYYAYLCKRACFHDEYLLTFNRVNVTLVDTQGQGLERMTDAGVVALGVEYPLDCVIFATGFEFDTPYTQRIGFDVSGRDGIALSKKWAGGLRTLHGLTMSGFPNLFVMPGVNAQSVVTANMVHTLAENAQHISYIVSEVLARGGLWFELRPEAEEEWVQTILRDRRDVTGFLAMCTPGRNNNEGRLVERPLQNANWGGAALTYFALLREWRDSGGLPGVEIGGAGPSVRTGRRKKRRPGSDIAVAEQVRSAIRQ